jgi:hypothetical protein
MGYETASVVGVYQRFGRTYVPPSSGHWVGLHGKDHDMKFLSDDNISFWTYNKQVM